MFFWEKTAKNYLKRGKLTLEIYEMDDSHSTFIKNKNYCEILR